MASTVWPEKPRDNGPEEGSAEIVLPKGHLQFEGDVVASRVRHHDAHYLILKAKPSDIDEFAEDIGTYCAFRNDVDVGPSVWDHAPYVMCRAEILEGYNVKPFWGWEAHTSTPGEGWYRIADQNIETRTAPASQWLVEIQGCLLPQMEARLKRLPEIIERCERIVVARDSMYPEDLKELSDLKRQLSASPPACNQGNITNQDLVKDNLVGTVDNYWRSEQPEPDLESSIRDFQSDIPRLQRRLIQGTWLLEALRTLGTRPIEMKRTMVYAERRFSLPVPVHPLSVTVKNTLRPSARIKLR